MQNLRKESGLEITDHITLTMSPNTEVKEALEIFGNYLKEQVLADKIVTSENDGMEIDIDGLKLNIIIAKQ